MQKICSSFIKPMDKITRSYWAICYNTCSTSSSLKTLTSHSGTEPGSEWDFPPPCPLWLGLWPCNLAPTSMAWLACPVLCAVTGQDTPGWTLLHSSFVIFSFPYPFMVLCYCSTHLLLFSYMNHCSIRVLSAISQKEELHLLGQVSLFWREPSCIWDSIICIYLPTPLPIQLCEGHQIL